MSGEYLAWTPTMLKRFKSAVKKAEAESAETFVFEEHEFLVAYARYLIEYLEGEFSKQH